MMLLLALLVLVSCATSQQARTGEEDAAFMREAVIEMMRVTSEAASEAFGGRATSPSPSDAVPPAAAAILASADTVPGLRNRLDRYLDRTAAAVADIAAGIPAFLEEQVFPPLEPEDPARLVSGPSDAVTQYFSLHAAPALGRYISDELGRQEEMRKAWEDLLRVWNIWAESRNLLGRGAVLPVIAASPESAVSAWMLDAFMVSMRSREALVRVVALSYDNPLIGVYFADR